MRRSRERRGIANRSQRLLAILLSLTLLVGLAGCASSKESVSGAAKSPPRGAPVNDGIPQNGQPYGVVVGGEAPAPPPPPPQLAPKPTPQKTGEADRDADGIPDSHDAVPVLDPSKEVQKGPQLIVYTAKVTMAVYQVDQGVAKVERLARDVGGYLSMKSDREITIRVPRARFEAALSAIDKIGDILHRNITAEDVTDEFLDAEIRIKNAKAMQARLRQLLDRAAVKDALEIEKELRRVTEELEVLEGKLKLLSDKIAYSTITVTFEARGTTLQASRIQLPFPWLGELGLPRLLSLEDGK